MQQLVELRWGDPQDRCALVDETFVHHIDRNLQCGRSGTLAGAGLQHPQLTPLNGKFDVLGVLVMRLQRLGDLLQRGKALWHPFF